MGTGFAIRSAKQFAVKLTCRIQKKGRLGFGEDEKRLMKLEDGVYVTFVSNEADVPITHLIIKREKDEDSFELRNGNAKYPFVDAKLLFDFYRFDYVNKTYIFDLIREAEYDDELKGEVYRANLRINDKNSSTLNNGQADEEDITD